MSMKAHTPKDLHELAREALGRRDLEAAHATLGIAFELDGNDAEAMCIMSDLLEMAGEELEAVGYAILAVNTDPESREAKLKFLRQSREMSFTHYNPNVESALLRCLETPGLACGAAHELWGKALAVHPTLGKIYTHVTKKRVIDWGNPFGTVTDFGPLLEPLFLLGLARMEIPYQPLEEFLARLREFLLEEAEKKLTPQARYEIACALAKYCFSGHYVIDSTAKEEKTVDALQEKITKGDAENDVALALYACYRPLHTLANARQVEQKHAGTYGLGMVVRQQITEALSKGNIS